jgi:hypothetical protein
MQDTSTAMQASVNERGAYGAGAGRQGKGAGAAIVLVGMTVAIYALSPGARYWYKHGHLPR